MGRLVSTCVRVGVVCAIVNVPLTAMGQTCDGNRRPDAICHRYVEVPVDDACEWTASWGELDAGSTDPDGALGEAFTCAAGPVSGAGFAVVPTGGICRDTCGAVDRCFSLVVPRDRTAPAVTADTPDVHIPLADGGGWNWTNIAAACGVQWTDNCHNRVLQGIIDVESSNPNENMVGGPGFFWTSGMMADWAGAMFNLDSSTGVGARTYTFRYAILDLSGNLATVDCRVHIGDPEPDVPEDGICNGNYGPPEDAGVLDDPAIDEVSGLVASRVHDGVLWLHNDSGDTARLFAVSTEGAHIGTLEIPGVSAVDFEDIARAACPDGDGSCLWVADVGNNTGNRADLAVYAVREPAAGELIGDRVADAVWRFPIRYPDGEGIDSEALVVEPDGSGFYLFEKVDGPVARLFATPPQLTPDAVNALEVLAVFAAPGVPIPQARMITGADLHPSGDRLVVRTYVMSVEYRFAADQGIADIGQIAPLLVAFGPVSEPQGEAIGYSADGVDIWTISEGVGAALHTCRCGGEGERFGIGDAED